MKIIGSQHRETLKESGYEIVGRGHRQVVLRPKEGGPLELWYANNHQAGYTIQIGRWGYEFGCDFKPEAKP